MGVVHGHCDVVPGTTTHAGAIHPINAPMASALYAPWWGPAWSPVRGQHSGCHPRGVMPHSRWEKSNVCAIQSPSNAVTGLHTGASLLATTVTWASANRGVVRVPSQSQLCIRCQGARSTRCWRAASRSAEAARAGGQTPKFQARLAECSKELQRSKALYWQCPHQQCSIRRLKGSLSLHKHPSSQHPPPLPCICPPHPQPAATL